MRLVGKLDPIPADRSQESTKTVHRPTHAVCSYTPDYESTRNRWTDFWWKPEKLMEGHSGKNGHTHGTEPPAGWRGLATSACIKKPTFVSQLRFRGSYVQIFASMSSTSLKWIDGLQSSWRGVSLLENLLQFLTFYRKLRCLCYCRDHSSAKGGVRWWTHWLIFSALISGVGKRTDGLINSTCKGSSPDLAADVCQACVSPAHGPPLRGQRAVFGSERCLHQYVSLPDEEGTEECHTGPPGAELAILTSARKRSPELTSQLQGDLILSFSWLKSCC